MMMLSSSSRSSGRKRAAGIEATALVATSPKRPATKKSFSDFFLENRVESLQGELEHERSMRALDKRKHQQAEDQLKRKIEFAKEEADGAKQLLEEHQTEHERVVRQLRESKKRALDELRKCQIELEEARSQAEAALTDENLTRTWQDKCTRLEAQVRAQIANETAMQEKMDELRLDMEERLEQQRKKLQAAVANEAVPPGLEDAPPTILKELNRIRIELAESQRSERQLQRRVKDGEQRIQTLIQEREKARLSSHHASNAAEELRSIHAKHDEAVLENERWKQFAQKMTAQLEKQGIKSRSSNPPEVSTVLRFVEQAQSKAEEAERKERTARKDLESYRAEFAPLGEKLKTLEDKLITAATERKSVESQLEAANQTADALRAQQSVLKREADSLRALIQTYDSMPPSASPRFDTSLQTTQVSLDSARAELQLVTNDRDRLSRELEKAASAQKEHEQEMARVREKFGKIREALQAEKQRVAAAEQRAMDAETLAGKGSFNPDETRILRFQENPLVQALREEVAVLKRQVEHVKVAGSGTAAGSGEKPLVTDPGKLNQRLQEAFQEHIARYREGVYFITGFKVDMTPGDAGEPSFKVRSEFASSGDDYHEFVWPKSKKRHHAPLNLLNTDFAKSLVSEPCHEYLSKHHSIPAYMASVQLHLFQQQTTNFTG